jgi:hypothetical protein
VVALRGEGPGAAAHRAQGDATRVTWAMRGPQPFMAKVVGLFLDMDHMIGKDFEAGLANLKAITEK